MNKNTFPAIQNNILTTQNIKKKQDKIRVQSIKV